MPLPPYYPPLIFWNGSSQARSKPQVPFANNYFILSPKAMTRALFLAERVSNIAISAIGFAIGLDYAVLRLSICYIPVNSLLVFQGCSSKI
jgi:hypothetical protein